MNDEPNLEESIEAEGTGTDRRLIYRIIGFVFITAALLLAIYGIVALSAWRQGQDLRAEKAQSALEEDLNSQFTLAQEDVKAGNFSLALRRLEWVLTRDPKFPGAGLLQDEARNKLNLLLTPSPTATLPATAEVVEDDAGPDPTDSFMELERLIEAEDWKALLTAASEFQVYFPNHRRQETDKMLYDAYIELGSDLIGSKQVELGLFYFSQAERLGDLPIEVEDQRSWAELYLTGIGYFGVDWAATVLYFRDLCAAAPFYQDACVKFHQALVAYADQYSGAQDWCPAEGYYREAIEHESSPELVDALERAVEGCAEATPTPTATLQGEEQQEGTPTPESE
ncbi:MAG: hypothetical protein BMS9Abin02_0663 [Anaerolineae bacterium]|nr:MAG: hypothetical protein BMS9Abin02_0663 [Anaerolineae bacterium]